MTQSKSIAPQFHNDAPALQASINYFSRDPRFLTEKPYTTSFPVEGIEGANVSNHAFDATLVNIYDLRDSPHPSLDTQGFTYLTAPTAMTIDDFDIPKRVRFEYFTELREVVRKAFPRYRSFAFFDYEIRKRSELYPTQVGAAVEHAQPLGQAHVDYSVYGAQTRLEKVLGDTTSHLLGTPCDLLNIWRPTIGPNDDWPLTLCDFQTIDPEQDVIPNDIVYENSVGEDAFLRSNKAHKWYYLSRHEVNEIIVWRNTNLPDGIKPRAFHSAFENPLSSPHSPRRQSIEVRVAAFL